MMMYFHNIFCQIFSKGRLSHVGAIIRYRLKNGSLEILSIRIVYFVLMYIDLYISFHHETKLFCDRSETLVLKILLVIKLFIHLISEISLSVINQCTETFTHFYTFSPVVTTDNRTKLQDSHTEYLLFAPA